MLMRANRLLGATLVERNLVKIEDLETANEKLIEIVTTEQPRTCTILGILAYDMKVIKEDDVLHHVVETDGVGLVDLRDYEVPEDMRKNADEGACWATWSVPFDQEEEFFFPKIALNRLVADLIAAFFERALETRPVRALKHASPGMDLQPNALHVRASRATNPRSCNDR